LAAARSRSRGGSCEYSPPVPDPGANHPWRHCRLQQEGSDTCLVRTDHSGCRDDNPEKLSPGCQFYIVANKDGLKRLDGNYTIYGQVFKGMDVVKKIVSVPKDSNDQPLTPITLHIDVIEMTAEQLAKYGIKPQ